MLQRKKSNMTQASTEETTVIISPRRSWLATRWLHFVLAVTFLTRLPLPVAGEASPADLRASMGWYPLIGLGLGALGWGIFSLACLLFPALPSAALTIILLESFTGALHLDGFMDTCDGLGSNRPRERALEIMKDSRVGAMGVFGAIAVIVLKVTAVAAFTPKQALPTLLICCSASRVLPIWDVTLFRYARSNGIITSFVEGKSPWALAIASLCTLLIALAAGHLFGLLLALVALLLTLLLQTRIAIKLHGLTGDVYGMGIELAETLVLLLGTAVLK